MAEHCDVVRTLMSSVRLTRLRFELRSRARFWLPDWPGSMLRGALGTCLKRLEDLSVSSAYGSLYRERRALDGRECDRETDVPRPYLVEWPVGPGRVLQAGDGFTFDVVLFGAALHHAAAVTTGVARAAEVGLGTHRVPHELVSVRQVEGGPVGVRLADLDDPLPGDLGESLELHALTPLIAHREPRLAREPTAEMLLVASLRRLRQLATAHGDEAVGPERLENALRGSIEGLRLDASRLRAIVTERDSRNSPVKLRMSGLIGPFTLHGELERWRPLLRTMLALHVGRQVSQGMGRVGVARPRAREATLHAAAQHVATG